MGTFGDPVGRALLEGSVKRITSLSYDFDVWGASLQELGQKAARKAAEFYGDQSFVFTSMSVNDAQITDRTPNSLRDEVYHARVYTEVV